MREVSGDVDSVSRNETFETSSREILAIGRFYIQPFGRRAHRNLLKSDNKFKLTD